MLNIMVIFACIKTPIYLEIRANKIFILKRERCIYFFEAFLFIGYTYLINLTKMKLSEFKAV